jgi:GTPase SAR1 family protein
MNSTYNRDAAAAVCVYDITNKPSFDNLQHWIIDLKKHAPEHIVIGMCGNKSDLINQEEVSFEEGR